MNKLYNHIHHAASLIKEGDLKAAATACQNALNAAPDHPDALYLAALVTRAGNNPNQSHLFLQRALAASCVAQGVIDLAFGNKSGAVAHFEQALLFDPYNVQACNRLGEIYWKHRNLTEEDLFFQKPPLDCYKTPIGTYYIPSDAPEDCIGLRMKAGKIFEEVIFEAARQYIGKGSCVLDVGANFGQMTLLFSKEVGENGAVLSFEAEPYVCYILRQNIKANSANNVQIFQNAVFDKSGEMVVFPVPDIPKSGVYGSFGIDPTAREGRKIPTLAIDDIPIDRHVHFMKVDTQGSDLRVLQGAEQTIRKHKMPILFEYEEEMSKGFGQTFDDYAAFISKVGYKIVRTVNEINFLIVPAE